jgi:hypothetical protein
VTDQPIDHRAEPDHRVLANHWLIKAAASVNEGAEGFSQAEALIGIGHALLAGIRPGAPRNDAQGQTLTGVPPDKSGPQNATHGRA